MREANSPHGRLFHPPPDGLNAITEVATLFLTLFVAGEQT
jgi:hypothetical protein